MGDRSFDSIIIGAGQAGPSLAVTLAKRGEKVALIEAERLGGTCINNGCTPTKTLRKSARVAYIARRAAEFGIDTGPVTVDFPRAMTRMRERVDTSRAGLESWVRGSGVEVIIGHGKIEGREASSSGSTLAVRHCWPPSSFSTPAPARSYRRSLAWIWCPRSTTARCWR